MDVSFSVKTQTLIYSFSFSPSSSFSSHLRLPTAPRREFLGGRQLRPPGIRSRSQCRELGLRARARPCLSSASLHGNFVLVAAVVVATFAVLRVVYLNYTSRRNGASRLSGPELPDVLATLESKQDNMVEHGSSKVDFVAIGSIYTESMDKMEDVWISCETADSKRHNSSNVNEVQPLKFQTTVLACEDILTAKFLKQNVYEVPTYSPSENFISTCGISHSYQSEMVTETDAAEQESSVDAIPETFLGKQEEVALSQIITEPTLSCYTVYVNNVSTESSTKNKLQDGLSEEGELQVLISDSFVPHSFKEASAMEEEKLPELRSLPDFSGTYTTPYVTLQEINNSSSLTKPLLKGAEIPPKDSPLATEERAHFVCYEKSSRGNGEDALKTHGPKHNIGRRQFHWNRGSSRLPHLIGKSFNDAKDPSVQLRTYNRLLRDARLIDCIELLESMEKMGILDMDKVYHARFLKTCKSQKAVKEAFRFIKLVKKPTLSTFNMLLSVCASSQDSEGAYQVLLLVKKAGLRPDCQLYTTLISTCAKSGKVDAMFEVFHEMVNAGVEPNAHTYGALIDGCARAGQVAKAFGAYGIMRSKKVKPDRVVFNALITACGQSGAVDRAFDVLAEMTAEPQPIEPDHVTVGALMRTCAQAGQADRAREVYKMLQQYNIKGDADVYTIAVRGCGQTGDLEFALSIYDDMIRNGVVPDEMFFSTLIDVAGHAGKIDVAFEILQDAKIKGIHLGEMSYSSLMGACSNAKSLQKALELHEKIKGIKLIPTTSTLNALVTCLCDGDQLLKAVEVLDEMKEAGVHPNTITYSILLVSCEKKDEVELGFKLLSQAKTDGVRPNLIMCLCLTGLCLRRFEKACSLGEPVLSFDSGKPQIDCKWTSWAIMIYRETIQAGLIPTIEVFSQVLGCLQFPRDSSLRNRFVENLGLTLDIQRNSKLYSLLDGFGEYDSRSFSILEEASSLGVVPYITFKESPIFIDARKLLIHTVEVYILTVLKGLRHRLAAGARLPTITILLPIEKTLIASAQGEKTVNLAGRIGQAVGALLRRLGLPYQGDKSYGKIRISGLALRRWFKPKIGNSSFGWKPTELTSSQARLSKGIIEQQRNIRSSSNLSLE